MKTDIRPAVCCPSIAGWKSVLSVASGPFVCSNGHDDTTKKKGCTLHQSESCCSRKKRLSRRTAINRGEPAARGSATSRGLGRTGEPPVGILLACRCIVGVSRIRVVLYSLEAFFRRLIVAPTSMWATLQVGCYQLLEKPKETDG